MIQIEAIRIIELRGIRELEIKPKRKSFVISGGNGSSKSGVVDAIEFALTGGMSRLAGKGTVGLTVLRHGPHVDRRDGPSVAGGLRLRFALNTPHKPRRRAALRRRPQRQQQSKKRGHF